jgi:small subunit ribosomal protein S21
MIQVTARHGEPADRLLQRFKRLCVREGLFREIKRRRFYEKPSDKMRRKMKEAKRALRKRLKREERLRKRR